MRLAMMLLFLSLFAISAWAGTWSDGFETEKPDNWQLVPFGPTTIKMENGELSVEVHNEIISYVRAIDSNGRKDYTVTVKVKIIEIFGSFVDGGIMIHENALNNYYYFFVADRGPQVHLGVPPEGKGAFAFPSINGQILKGKAKVFTPELDHWYTLKAITKDKNTEFFVDNELVGAFDYDALESGSVGLVVSNAHVHFDDFVVTGLDIPDGGPGGITFMVQPEDKPLTTWARLKSHQ